MPNDQKIKHFGVISRKTAMSRKQNYKPAWNKGKKGIYSEQTIEKIRQATIHQLKNQGFRKTRIERIIEKLLVEFGVHYKYSFCLENRQFDFVIQEYQIIIECDGDYWHANPKFYPNPKGWQLERIKIDREKNLIAIRNGYRILRFWEDDILNRIDQVRNVIASYIPLATT